ncbi:IQ domain-containing protein H isoform X3 [Octopus bimaculoides]|nr:IQ domain-containing protein H isoform X3 [Octopus bimaculoides]
MESYESSAGCESDFHELSITLKKAEEGLQGKAEQLVQDLNSQVKLIGSNVNDLKRNRTLSSDSISLINKNLFIGTSASRETLLPQRQFSKSSPGIKLKQQLAFQAAIDPFHAKNRHILYDTYGIQLPLISQKRQGKEIPGSGQKVIVGTTVEPLVSLPKQNRFDPLNIPLSISEKDAQKGILNLIERGLIPSAAQLSLEPSPVSLKTIKPLEGIMTEKKKVTPTLFESPRKIYPYLKLFLKSISSDFKVNLLPVKDDISKSEEDILTKRKGVSLKIMNTVDKNQLCGMTVQIPTENMKDLSLQRTLSTTFPTPPPTTPTSHKEDTFYKIAIQDGRTRSDTVEYLAFKETHQENWGKFATLLHFIEQFLTDFCIPFVFADGNKLKDFVNRVGTERKPEVKDLINMLINPKTIEDIVKVPGRKYCGPHGKIYAAITIQSNWRRMKDRKKFLEYQRKKWASSIVVVAWTVHLRVQRYKALLRQTRADNIEVYKLKIKAFRTSWKRIQNSKRVVIHMPSLGYPEYIRNNINFFNIQENNQICRICDIVDPNVDVIYISPTHLTEEAEQYYGKLLALRPAILSGDINKISDMMKRVTFIVPEVITQFSRKKMCLASMLKYSPQALKRIKNLVKGREAYIVPGMVYMDDMEVAKQLDLAILGPDPETAQLYSTKSGVKRIFQSSEVNMPPGIFDIYTEEQLHESLAQLIIENFTIGRWLLKFNTTVSSNGIAYCDTMHLKCFVQIYKEAIRYGDKWTHKWAHESSLNILLNELPEYLRHYANPVNKSRYCAWEIYKKAFLLRGGIIEAYPPSDFVTAVQVDLLIAPNGETQILCTGDQIISQNPFDPWGLSVPQCSIEPPRINCACLKIANSCKGRGILGYVTVIFATFICEQTKQQQLWCIDMKLGYSDSLAMFQLMKYISNTYLDIDTHHLIVAETETPTKEELSREKCVPRKKTQEKHYRYGVLSTKLYHSNLSIIHYSVFFQMCRAHGIGYDIKEKQGTLFTLIDYAARNYIGMLVICKDLRNGLAAFARNLNTLHEEVSSPNMQGETNFKEAINSIEEIIGITVLNEQEDKKTKKK